MHQPDEDPIVQEIPWVIMGMTIPVQITASGNLLVDGSPVHQASENLKHGDTGKKAVDLSTHFRSS
jgi:hypothetical protein